MALGAAWAKEMVLNGSAITYGTARSAKADLGGYVGMRMIANTNSAFSSRVLISVSYTVPAGAIAFVVNASFNDNARSNPNYYSVRLYNTTKSSVAAGPNTANVDRATPSKSPGNVPWSISWTGTLTAEWGTSIPADAAAYYPVAGVAGDTLRLEAWTSGDGAYRIQDMSVYLVVVSAATGDPLP